MAEPTPDDPRARRIRSLRTSIAASIGVLRRRARTGPWSPTVAAAPRRCRSEDVDPFDLGLVRDDDDLLVAQRVFQMQGELRQLLGRDGTCGARCRDGHPCRASVENGKNRCKLHGGASTGAKTAEGCVRRRAGAIAQHHGIPLEVAVEFVRAPQPPHQTPRERLLAYLAERAAARAAAASSAGTGSE